jgi:AcrR family transcriptional regulator
VGKGDLTRQAILERATGLASLIGLEGLSIGRLAGDLDLSKSGLFAHFRSKEALQLEVIEFAGARFVEAVVRPALAAPRGEPRVRAIFEHWLRWPERSGLPGGCFFVAAAAELDDQPGPAQQRLIQLQRDWLDVMANSVRTAIAEGDFRADLDPEQFAHELYGIMLMAHHSGRLLKDPETPRRTRAAFESLLGASRAEGARARTNPEPRRPARRSTGIGRRRG